MPEVYVGLGSNVEPMIHLARAVEALARDFAPVDRSPVYRSPAAAGLGDDYLNMVVRFATDRGIEALRARFAGIEAEEGRDRHEPNRCALDVDLLLYGRRVDAERGLPRTDVVRCPFVLAPLADLAPALAHPVTGETIADLWARLDAMRPALTRLGPLSG